MSQYLTRPVMQQGEARAAFRLVQIGRRDEDRDAALAQGIEDAPEIPPRHGIDPGRRFVEQEGSRAYG